MASPPSDPDAHIRVDLTHHRIVTIDDASTTEVDDGLSVEELPDGRRRLWVHVADPSRWMQPGSDLDMEARRRASTLYLPVGGPSRKAPDQCLRSPPCELFMHAVALAASFCKCVLLSATWSLLALASCSAPGVALVQAC